MPEDTMREGTWGQAVAELVDAVVTAFVRFWKQDIVQVGLAIGMFLALALPMLIVILVLWYLDSTGWRPATGFYKIGSLTGSPLADANLALACAGRLVAQAPSSAVRQWRPSSPT